MSLVKSEVRVSYGPCLQQEGGWTGMGDPSDVQVGQGIRQTDRDDDADMPGWDDDDLVAMQAEPMVR